MDEVQRLVYNYDAIETALIGKMASGPIAHYEDEWGYQHPIVICPDCAGTGLAHMMHPDHAPEPLDEPCDLCVGSGHVITWPNGAYSPAEPS